MSWSGESESHEALSDPMPRIYVCFCEKRFTTYPGIYLHLKSKHSHLFQKYKKLKITKLFKKTHDDKGIEIYRLQKLSETEGPGSYFTQKKIKQNKKRKREGQPRLELSPADNRQEEPLKKTETENFEPKPQEFVNEISMGTSVFPSMGSMGMMKNTLPQMNNYISYPSHQVTCSFMSPHMPGSYPQYQVHSPLPPAPYFSQPKPSLKKILEKFVLESPMMDRPLVKITIYDLMVFIDKNFQTLKDPRAMGRQFLSYCDQFDPLFVKPLLQEYIGKMNEELSHMQEEFSQTKRKKQIDYLVKFLVWLGELGLIELSLKITTTYRQNPQTSEMPPSTSTKSQPQSEIRCVVNQQHHLE